MVSVIRGTRTHLSHVTLRLHIECSRFAYSSYFTCGTKRMRKAAVVSEDHSVELAGIYRTSEGLEVVECIGDFLSYCTFAYHRQAQGS